MEHKRSSCNGGPGEVMTMATSGSGGDHSHVDDCKDGGAHCLPDVGLMTVTQELVQDILAPKFRSEQELGNQTSVGCPGSCLAEKSQKELLSSWGMACGLLYLPLPMEFSYWL